MKNLEEILRRFRSAFRKKELDQELDEEFAAHLEMAVEENLRRGLPPEEARRVAAVQFGGCEPAKELHRDSRALPWLETSLQDLRYTFRTLKRDAGFAVFAILIIGLGIGASSVVFSVFRTLLVKPLPFRDPGRLVWLKNNDGDGMSGQTVRVDNLLELRKYARSYEDVAGYFAFYGVGDVKLTGQDQPERLSEVPVSQNFFTLLGVHPAMGRLFTTEECRWNGPAVVLLAHSLWERRFQADPHIVGQKLRLNDQAVTVIGVLPSSFDFGSVFAPGRHIDLFAPFPLSAETNKWGNTLALIGKLKRGSTTAAAQAELNVLQLPRSREHPEYGALNLQVSKLSDHVSGSLWPALFMLACSVTVVMLIVCANLSNLLLSRMAGRRKEMAVRTALGAGRYRLVRQMLTESLVLSGLGAILGLALAVLGIRFLSHLDALSIPLLNDMRIDGAALGFMMLAAAASGLLFGVVPALHTRDLRVAEALKDTGRSTSSGRSQNWTRNFLVVTEVAFACVLLVGAGLLIRSFITVLDVNLGFQPERAGAMRIDPDSRYATQAQRNGYFDEALRLVRALPGVHGAALTDALPLGRNRSWTVGVKGKTFEHGNPDAFVRIVSDGYLKAMGVPLKEGREFTMRDTPSSEPVIVINASMARALFPGQSAVGQILGLERDRRVVGVVGDVRHLALETGAGYEMYIPIRQTNDYDSVDLVIRTTSEPSRFASAVRAALRPLDPNIPGNDFRPLQLLVDKAVSPRRFTVMLLGGFAGFALILASLGIYAVISYSVSQRRHEIGIRLALGASTGQTQAAVIRQTMALAAIGMVAGTLAALAAARAMSALLFGTKPADIPTFAGMLLILSLVALAAGYVPAYRASHINPTEALRTS